MLPSVYGLPSFLHNSEAKIHSYFHSISCSSVSKTSPGHSSLPEQHWFLWVSHDLNVRMNQSVHFFVFFGMMACLAASTSSEDKKENRSRLVGLDFLFKLSLRCFLLLASPLGTGSAFSFVRDCLHLLWEDSATSTHKDSRIQINHTEKLIPNSSFFK